MHKADAGVLRSHLGAPSYRTLFLTDMWERLGFYSMQAIPVLYARAPRSRGGLGLPTADAIALFGAWIDTPSTVTRHTGHRDATYRAP